ncbi:MAG: hypothetical protein WBM83_16285, partial [Flavobacteriaceae bacterium]
MACNKTTNEKKGTISEVPVYKDLPYVQDYSVKYVKEDETTILSKAFMDRNGVIQVMSSKGLLRTHDGQFLFPGQLVQDKTYRPLTDKKITSIALFQDQFIYLDDKAVFSNAWAGSLYLPHHLPKAQILASGSNFDFLISDGKTLEFLSKDKAPWQGEIADDRVLDIRYHAADKSFWVLGQHSISSFNTTNNTFETLPQDQEMTCFAIFENKLILGTNKGYLELDPKTNKPIGALHNKLPVNELTAIAVINGELWFGSDQGAFKLKKDGKFDYYYGKRWLPGNEVLHISKGNDGSVLVLTEAGLGQIVFKEMTLHDKADYFENQVRNRHIRLGFNASLDDMDNGNIDSGRLTDSDNDGLWTTMYLAGQVFRYSVTESEEALQNCREAMDAMERLFNINPVPGFP